MFVLVACLDSVACWGVKTDNTLHEETLCNGYSDKTMSTTASCMASKYTKPRWVLSVSRRIPHGSACRDLCTPLEVLELLTSASQCSLPVSVHFTPPTFPKSSSDDVRKLDDEIWELISNFSQGPPASFFSSSSGSTSSFPVRTSGSTRHSSIPPSHPSALQASVWASGPHPGAPGHSPHLTAVKVSNGLSGGFHF